MNTSFTPGNMIFAITFLFFTMLFQTTTMLFIIYMIKNEISKKIKIVLYVFLTLDILIFLFLINMTYIVATALKYY
ncbi:NADH dehydrogenase [Bacillus toyonensis]|nr:NADH dehydrogenase [Bacillus toyonensis]